MLRNEAPLIVCDDRLAFLLQVVDLGLASPVELAVTVGVGTPGARHPTPNCPCTGYSYTIVMPLPCANLIFPACPRMHPCPVH